jgi:hypothetical protein
MPGSRGGSGGRPSAASRERREMAVHDCSRTSAVEHRSDDGPLRGLLVPRPSARRRPTADVETVGFDSVKASSMVLVRALEIRTRRISMTTRKELVEALHERYRNGAFGDRIKILDEFVALSGYHRKHAIRVLHAEFATATAARTRNRLCDEAVRQALPIEFAASA